MRRQLSALLWRALAPTLEVAREEGREEVRAAVRDVLDTYAYTGIYTGQERVAVADIRRALDN